MLPRSKLVLAFAVAMLLLSGALLATTIAIRQHAPAADTESNARAGAAIGGPFTLVATDGKTVTDQTYRGKWMVIYFGYTFCPDACPTALNNLSVALKTLGADAANIQPLFITVDPRRDTRAVMAEYLKAFDPRIVGLTGSQAQTDAAAKAYHVYVEAQKGEGDNYLVDHSAYFYVMDGQGKFVDVIAGNVSGYDMAAKLRTMMERRA